MHGPPLRLGTYVLGMYQCHTYWNFSIKAGWFQVESPIREICLRWKTQCCDRKHNTNIKTYIQRWCYKYNDRHQCVREHSHAQTLPYTGLVAVVGVTVLVHPRVSDYWSTLWPRRFCLHTLYLLPGFNRTHSGNNTWDSSDKMLLAWAIIACWYRSSGVNGGGGTHSLLWSCLDCNVTKPASDAIP